MNSALSLRPNAPAREFLSRLHRIRELEYGLGTTHGDITQLYRGDEIGFITRGMQQCDGDSWRGWRTILKAAYGVPLDETELNFFHSVAQRDPPGHRVKELWLIVGRRGGKDSIASLMAVEAARFADCMAMRPGERAIVACLASDRDQASIVFNYIRGYFEEIPALRSWIRGDLPKTYRSGPIELTNSVDVRVTTNNFKAPRGRAVVCAIFDECLAAGTLISTERGDVPIESVVVGDRVHTRQGFKLVQISRLTDPDAELWRVRFSGSTEIIGTAAHPVYTVGCGFVALSELQPTDEALLWRLWSGTGYGGNVMSVEKLSRRGPVYNLQVEGCPEYFANGVLVHNCAFWRDENSATPDIETYRAIEPGMATISNAMLIGISTPYRKSGLLYQKYRTSFGREDPEVLVIQAETRKLNPMIDVLRPGLIDKALADDPEAARAEYLAIFREDLADFVPPEVVDAVVVPGRTVIEPQPGTDYFAFVDPSGGSRDSFTLAIAHAEADGKGVLDLLYERRAPFVPSAVVEEISKILPAYNVHKVTGDRYAGEWPVDAFDKVDVKYEHSELTKTDIYRDSLPLLMSGQVEYLDNKRLVSQTVSLERRTARGGRDTIDHPPNMNDDVVNAALGALVHVTNKTSAGDIWRRLAS